MNISFISQNLSYIMFDEITRVNKKAKYKSNLNPFCDHVKRTEKKDAAHIN